MGKITDNFKRSIQLKIQNNKATLRLTQFYISHARILEHINDSEYANLTITRSKCQRQAIDFPNNGTTSRSNIAALK